MISIDLDDFKINIRGSTGALVVGKPGSGKTVLVSYLMIKLMALGAFPLICDTKRSDFFSLNKILDRSNSENAQVAATPGQVAKMLRVLTDLMNQRYEHHQEHWGWDWVDYNLRPIVLVFDEFSATLSEADKATANEITGYLKQLIFKARQMGGIYLLLASQRLTADVLDRNISTEFSTRIGMQNLDRISLNLAFPGCNLDEVPIVENIPGHGLIYDDHFNTIIPQPFIAPDMSNVEVPLVVKKLVKKFENNSFSQESYWPW
jgi:DNA segregation ATPase FtsK/SpoIIIE-like protein